MTIVDNNILTALTLVLTVALAAPAPADPPGTRTWTGADANVLTNRNTSDRTFSDWTLECDETPCRASTYVHSETGEDLFRVSVLAGTPPRYVFATPLPLYLPDGLRITVEPNLSLPLPWYTCVDSECEARHALDPATDSAFRAGKDGSLTFSLVDGVQVRLRFSLVGYTDATAELAAVRPAPSSP